MAILLLVCVSTMGSIATTTSLIDDKYDLLSIGNVNTTRSRTSDLMYTSSQHLPPPFCKDAFVGYSTYSTKLHVSDVAFLFDSQRMLG